jgi:asparagine synthase (glutamine-hydrolysing)
MANVILTVDPDPARRAATLHAAAPILPPVAGLVSGCAAHGDFAAAWACAPANPASASVADPDTCIVWGEAVDREGRPVTAERLRAFWGQPGQAQRASGGPEVFDGFYAAAAYDRRGRLVVAADPLGLFPIYYWQDGSSIVVATSPELFRCRPGFVPRFHPAGLAGILLTNGLLDGQTVWQGVRRLPPGHALFWRPGEPAREARQYTPAASERYFDLALSGHADLIERTLAGIIARRLPRGEPVGMLLSGGLDSRTLAGLFRRAGLEVHGVTYGEPADIEWQCARRVARAAGVRQRGVRIPPERLAEAAELKIRWEHLANGFSPLDDWLFFPDLRALPRRVVGGHIMGAVLGCNVVRGDEDMGAVGFDHFLSTVTAWGIAPATLARLLRRDVFGEAAADLVERLREIYETTDGFGYQRLWRFALHHRERFYVGVSAWQLSFGCVPVFPGADRALIEVAAGMPAAALEGRRA